MKTGDRYELDWIYDEDGILIIEYCTLEYVRENLETIGESFDASLVGTVISVNEATFVGSPETETVAVSADNWDALVAAGIIRRI